MLPLEPLDVRRDRVKEVEHVHRVASGAASAGMRALRPARDQVARGAASSRRRVPALWSGLHLCGREAGFRADLQRRLVEREALDADALSRREFAFGSYPWPLKGSALTDMWRKHHGPWGGTGNRAVTLGAAEQERATR